jgi:hypothetical protein
MKTTIAILLCGTLAAASLCAAPAAELDAVKANYTAEKARIEAAWEQQKTNAAAAYRLSLDTQMLALKKQGDLDSYLALETEKKRLASEKTINTNDDATALSGLIAQYRKAMQEAGVNRSRSCLTLMRQHTNRLTVLMQNYTRTDRLEEAKAVRNELQVAKTDLLFQEEETPPEPPKPTPPPPAKPTADDPAKNIPGTWSVTWRNMGKSGTDVVELAEDGSANCPKDHITGTWEVKNRQLFIHWGRTDNTFNLTADARKMMGHNKQGASLTAVKTADP